jgi:hypothetical protein
MNDTGMLWQSDNKRPLRERVEEAIKYYQKKFGSNPEAAYVNPKLLEGHEMIVDGIAVKPMRLPLSLLWLELADAAKGVERKSLELLEQMEMSL